MHITVSVEACETVAEVQGNPELRVTAASEADALEALATLIRHQEVMEDAHDAALFRERLASDDERIPHEEVKRLLGAA
ncbi:hypothetical protein L6R46_06050 [Myxococcota bacterium]|nr:hypothetical protein [Myxococcota bacterium]